MCKARPENSVWVEFQDFGSGSAAPLTSVRFNFAAFQSCQDSLCIMVKNTGFGADAADKPFIRRSDELNTWE